MIGAYIIPIQAGLRDADRDPRTARLRAAWPRWRFGRCADGIIAAPFGLGDACHLSVSAYGPARTCADGLIWLPPVALPSLYDLAREEIPAEVTEIRLRRLGLASVPLGLGPVYGVGPKRGSPSSEYGALAAALYRIANDKAYVWGDDEEREVERLIFLGFRLCYHLTREIWDELAPYDLDEVGDILQCAWGSHPKASSDGGSSSPPSLPEPSGTPGLRPPSGTGLPSSG